jgi:hypothetical protein
VSVEPPWCALKMYPLSLLEDTSWESERGYAEWVIRSKIRSSSLRPTLALRTGESGYSSWHTPHGMAGIDATGKHGGAGGGEFAKQANQWKTPNANDGGSEETHRGVGTRVKLLGQANNWPTPDARDSQPEGLEAGLRRLEKYSTQGLQTATLNWPTPRSEDSEQCGNHPGATDSLNGATKLWATPRTITGGAETAERKQELGRTESGGGDLQAQATFWQTPATDSFRSRGGGRKDEMGLDQQARMYVTWPTPQACRRGAGQDPEKRKAGNHSVNLQDAVTVFPSSLPAPATMPDGQPSSESAPTSRRPSAKKRLNPRFVEFLQGLPIGWTSSAALTGSEDWATWCARSRERLRSLCCSEESGENE